MSIEKATVNGTILRWARDTIGLETETVARKLKIKPAQIDAWEEGSDKPSFPQLEKLSDLYLQPLVAFFNETPPSTPPWPTDYRIFPTRKNKPLTHEVRKAIWEAQWKQSVAAELRAAMEEKPSLPRLQSDQWSDPEAAAEEIRKRIGPDFGLQQVWARTPYQLFAKWRAHLEQVGILVFRLNIPKKEVRGFALQDPLAPLIAVSSKDWRNATIFSLFHELAHILLGETCTCNDLAFRLNPTHMVEKKETHCNHFAGAFLVLGKQLLSNSIVRGHTGKTWSDQDLANIAHEFGVSREVILRRLVILERADIKFYQKWKQEQEDRWKDEEGDKVGFAVPHGYARKVLSREGHAYPRLILNAYASKLISRSEVLEYIDVKARHLQDIQTLLLKTEGEK